MGATSTAPPRDGTESARPRAESESARPRAESETAPSHGGPIGGPVWVAWREGTLTRAEELQALCEWVTGRDKGPQVKDGQQSDQVLVKAVHRHLDAAREAARAAPLDPKRRLVLVRRIFRNGPLIERAMSNLDAAEAQLLNLAPANYVLGQMPCLLRHVQCHLPPADPARQEFERIARRLGINDPDHPSPQDPQGPQDPQNPQDQSLQRKEKIVEAERGKIVTTVRAASS